MHFLAGDLTDGIASYSDRRYRVDHYRGLPREASVAARDAVLVQAEEKIGAAARKRAEAAREHEETMRYVQILLPHNHIASSYHQLRPL